MSEEYESETELLNEFKNYMRDPKNVENATDYLYKSLVDETVLGIVFEIHHEIKTGNSQIIRIMTRLGFNFGGVGVKKS